MQDELYLPKWDDELYTVKGDYWINHYMEQISFARYKVQSQLNSAYERQKEPHNDIMLFGGVMLAGFFIYLLLMIFSHIQITIIFAVANVLRSVWHILLLIIDPVCIFKILRGALLSAADRKRAASESFPAREELYLYVDEIKKCQSYIQLYDEAYKDMERWKTELANGKKVDMQKVNERFEALTLEPKIPIVKTNHGSINKTASACAIIAGILLFLLLIAGT